MGRNHKYFRGKHYSEMSVSAPLAQKSSPNWDERGPSSYSREVEIGLVLDQRIIPAVSNHDSLQGNLVSAGNILRILLLNVLIENRSIVPPITFSSKVKAVSGVLLESSHETLQSLIEIGSCGPCCVGRQSQVGIAVCPTSTHIDRIIRAGSIRHRDNSIRT